MKQKRRASMKKFLVTVIACLLASAWSQGATITLISDSFSKGASGDVNLNGQAADIGGVWVAPTTAGAYVENVPGQLWMTWPATSSPDRMNIAFTPVNGSVYDLSVDIVYVNNGFASVGFAGTNGTSGAIFTSVQAWGLMRDNGSVEGFANDLANNYVSAAGSGAPPRTVKVQLDTTNAAWKTSLFVNGVQQGSTFTFATNPVITDVFLGRFNVTAVQADNFVLTQTTIPEPASIALLVLGAVALLSRPRKQNG
jgi:hypothetical protein